METRQKKAVFPTILWDLLHVPTMQAAGQPPRRAQCSQGQTAVLSIGVSVVPQQRVPRRVRLRLVVLGTYTRWWVLRPAVAAVPALEIVQGVRQNCLQALVGCERVVIAGPAEVPEACQ